MTTLPKLLWSFVAPILLLVYACTSSPEQAPDPSLNSIVVQSDKSAQADLDTVLQYCLTQYGDSTTRFIQTLRPAIDRNIGRLDTLHDLVLATAYYKLGIQYYGIDQFDSAVVLFVKSRNIRQLMLSSADESLLKISKNIGVIYRNTKEPYLAKLHLLNAKNGMDGKTSPALRFEILQNLALVYKELGEYADSKDCFELAVVAAEQEQDTTARQENVADIGNDFATLYQELGDYELAYQKATAALPLCTRKTGKANCRNTLGLACKNLGRYAEAVTHFSTAIDLFKSLEDPESEASAHNNLGNTYRLLHQHDKARQELLRAIKLNDNNHSKPSLRRKRLSGNYNNVAEVDMDQGNYAAALRKLQLATVFLSPETAAATSGDLPPISAISGDLLLFMDVLRNRARCHYNLYLRKGSNTDRKLTVAVYDSLVPLMGRIRSQYLGDFSKIHFAAEADSILADAVTACYTFYDRSHDNLYAEKAFAFSDYSKANTLLEQVKLQNGQRLENVPAALWQEAYNIRKSLNAAEDDIDKLTGVADSSVQLSKTLERKLQLNEKLDSNTAAIRKLNPVLYAGPPSVSQIQQDLLGTDQTLVEYKIAGKQIFAFVVTPKGLKMYRLPLNAPGVFEWLLETIEGLRESIKKGPSSHAEHVAYCQHAFALYNYLIAPILPSLKTPRIVIVPEGGLDRIPFETLISSEGDPVITPEFLMLNRFSISYSYSVGLLLEMTHKKAKDGLSNRVAAFAPSFTPGLMPGKELMPKEVYQHLPFQPMAYNKKEIDDIGKLVGTDPYQDSKANKSAFFAAAATHSVLHISTHAFLNDANPATSFLVFSQLKDALEPQELLFLRELNNTAPLDIELMVFTACETALGKNLKGEGAISMARGLASAGVKSFITTLWEVNQEKTAALIPEFYGQLKSGVNKTKDVALAEAKRQFLKKSELNRYPLFWAGLVINGDMTPIALEEPGSPWSTGSALGVVLCLACLALLGGWWLWKRKSVV